MRGANSSARHLAYPSSSAPLKTRSASRLPGTAPIKCAMEISTSSTTLMSPARTSTTSQFSPRFLESGAGWLRGQQDALDGHRCDGAQPDHGGHRNLAGRLSPRTDANRQARSIESRADSDARTKQTAAEEHPWRFHGTAVRVPHWRAATTGGVQAPWQTSRRGGG